MKNLHYLKKFAVMVMAAMMTLSTFAMPTFGAADSQITINGVEGPTTVDGTTITPVVTLYQVVKEDNGKWVLVDDEKSVTITETTTTDGKKTQVVAPTAAEVARIAADPGSLPSYPTEYVNGKYVSKSAPANEKPAPGVYVAVVTGTTGEYVYNPMVVSIDYEQGTPESSTVDAANTNFTGEAYAKRSKPEVNKTTEDNDGRYADPTHEDNNFGDEEDAKTQNAGTDQAGEEVKYKVVTTIPSYAANYVNPKFFFSDALQKGFQGYETEPVVKEIVGGQETTLVKNTDYWFVDENGNKVENFTAKGKQNFKIQFKVETGKLKREICIRYTAKLVEKDDTNHLAGLDPYTNKAKIEWTKSTNPEDDLEEADDETHHYTFDIDGSIGGGQVGKEIIKVGVDKDGNYIYNEKEAADAKIKWEALDGAEFAIYTTNDNFSEAVKEVQKVTTTDGGQMKFKGLDAGKYVIKETKAPDGYALNESLIPVEITPTFNAKGVMLSYTIKIADRYTNTYTVNAGTIVKTHNSADQADVDNTALVMDRNVGTLPSTGGMGTVLFTVGGIAIMALALFLLFGGKKKQHQK